MLITGLGFCIERAGQVWEAWVKLPDKRQISRKGIVSASEAYRWVEDVIACWQASR